MKIFDCFMFNNQIEIFNKRVEKHFDYVESFVVSQGKFNYDGSEKEFVDLSGKKLTHIINEEIISSKTIQRNLIMKGLEKCNTEDIIIFSRINEFVNFDRLLTFIKVLDFFPISLGISNRSNQAGPIVTKYKYLTSFTLSQLRNQRNFLLKLENGSFYEN